MEHFYFFLIGIIGVLAVVDLVVGLSNDAVNFLNSAIGSKAFSQRSILIVASFGLGIGALFSSGLLEIARTGIFEPSFFTFHQIIIVFVAAMVADIFILNFFNTLGIPTSTTVSILFCLLGAALVMGLIALWNTSQDFSLLAQYINTSKVSQIFVGIFLSIFIAFSIGAFVQFITRLFFTFEYEKNIKYFGALFAGVAISCVTGFIVLKGFKGISLINDAFIDWTFERLPILIIISLCFWSVCSYIAITYFKFPILKFIILLGLFGLALSFAGNDLVNFIGVPIAAYQSFEIWQAASLSTGISAMEFRMGSLSLDTAVPYSFLIISGFIMILTLWFSKSVLFVTKTEIELASQKFTRERFRPNKLSRVIVRNSIQFSSLTEKMMPIRLKKQIDKRFILSKDVPEESKDPSFDLIRAAVNLTVASVLISFATSLKLPLSTTYVTFMVAMGTALADRAWTRESAVYRVAGVLNVIGSWFLTSLVALLLAGSITFLIFYGEWFATLPILALLFFVLYKSYRSHQKRIEEEKTKMGLLNQDLKSVQDITATNSETILVSLKKMTNLFEEIIQNLATQKKKKLKKNKKSLQKLASEIESLKDEIIIHIQTKDTASFVANRFYVLNLGSLEDMIEAILQITKSSYNHVNNNHKNLTFNQIRGLKSSVSQNKVLFSKIENALKKSEANSLKPVIQMASKLVEEINFQIEDHIDSINKNTSSPKNIKLYIRLQKKSIDYTKHQVLLLKRYVAFYEKVADNNLPNEIEF
ncbi:MAG: inorganic phosphate transporter [Flavobacteriaceae bacterium]